MSPKARALLVSAVPFGATLALILVFGIDSPWHDDWYLIPGIEHVFEGKFSPDDYWQLHNEHVVVFPNAVIFGLARVTALNFKVQLLASLAFMTVATLWIGKTLLRVPGLPWW